MPAILAMILPIVLPMIVSATGNRLSAFRSASKAAQREQVRAVLQSKAMLAVGGPPAMFAGRQAAKSATVVDAIVAAIAQHGGAALSAANVAAQAKLRKAAPVAATVNPRGTYAMQRGRGDFGSVPPRVLEALITSSREDLGHAYRRLDRCYTFADGRGRPETNLVRQYLAEEGLTPREVATVIAYVCPSRANPRGPRAKVKAETARARERREEEARVVASLFRPGGTRSTARLTALKAKVRRKNGDDSIPAWARNLALLYRKANDVTEESLRLDRMNQDRVNQGSAPDAAATVAHQVLVSDVKAWVDAQNWGGTEYGYKPLVRWPTHVSHFRVRPTHKNPARLQNHHLRPGDWVEDHRGRRGSVVKAYPLDRYDVSFVGYGGRAIQLRGEYLTKINPRKNPSGFDRKYADACFAQRTAHLAASERYAVEAGHNPGGPAAAAANAHWTAARRWEECVAFVPGGMTEKAQAAAVRKAEQAAARATEADAAWQVHRAAIDRIKARRVLS